MVDFRTSNILPMQDLRFKIYDFFPAGEKASIQKTNLQNTSPTGLQK